MTHAKHPESELYADLVPAFEARGKPGFARELAGRCDREWRGTRPTPRSGALANQPEADFATQLMAVATLARTAAVEFSIGVEKDGTVVNAHEYQDAWGFLTAAREMLADMDTSDVGETDARALADEQLRIALGEFDALTAQRVDGKAATIHGAAARIEIEATMLP